MTSPRTKTASMRLHVYEVAHELADQAFVLVGKIAGEEERFLRDQLAHKSAAITRLVLQAAEADSVIERRALYSRARQSTVDCAAILDGLGKQGVIEAGPLETCRTTASKLVELLAPLIIPPGSSPVPRGSVETSGPSAKLRRGFRSSGGQKA